jgi:hypothetical protein
MLQCKLQFSLSTVWITIVPEKKTPFLNYSPCIVAEARHLLSTMHSTPLHRYSN